MRVQAYISSAVIGLAAVSVAMPMLNERAIVQIGNGGQSDSDSPDAATPAYSSASADAATSTLAVPTSTPTFDTGAWTPGEGESSVPNDGSYNATKYDNTSKFDDGLYHPNKTMDSTGPVTGADPSSSPITSDAPASSESGVVASGGMSTNEGPDRNGQSSHCSPIFKFLCF